MSEILKAAVDEVIRKAPPQGDAAALTFDLLVREAVQRLGWGTMTYACDRCSFEWRVWLALGVEGPAVLRDANLFQPAPFGSGRCLSWPVKADATPEERATYRHLGTCEGSMSHVRFREDKTFAPALIPDDAPRFVLGVGSARLVIPEAALLIARRFHADQEGTG